MMRISAMTTRTGVMPQPGSIPNSPRMVPSSVQVPLERWAGEYHFGASTRQPVDPSDEQPEAADGGEQRAGEVVALGLERRRQEGVKVVEPEADEGDAPDEERDRDRSSHRRECSRRAGEGGEKGGGRG